MRKIGNLRWSYLLVAMIIMLGLYLPNSSAQEAEIIPGKYIVMLRDDPQVVAESFGVLRTQTYQHAVTGMSISATEEQIERLRDDPRVLAVEPDRVVWAFEQRLPTGIDRINADLSSISKIDGNDERVDVDIAILDTGVDKDHPDLNVFRFVNFSPGSEDDDANGHGTHVAGIAAALDNDIGVVGVAPGAKVWAVKVLGDTGAGSLSDVIAGIDHVTENAEQIEVANLSLGGRFSSEILDQAIRNSVNTGVVYVVAAGNDAEDSQFFSPANHPDVITVSAMADSDGKPGGKGPSTGFGNDDTFASFSNFGDTVEIAGPGVEIESTFKDGGFNSLSGTSMASPHVAGVASLFVAQNGRDLNNDSKIDRNDVFLARDSIIDAAFLQSGDDGFSGDPDSSAEPLANAEFKGEKIADFELSADPSSVTLDTNDNTVSKILVVAKNNFTGTINLAAKTSSGSISAAIEPSTVVLDKTTQRAESTLSITSTNETGDFTVAVNAADPDSGISHTADVQVQVNQENGGGCLIATAAYGSELAPQVQLLREVRDSTVLSTTSGATFMSAFNEFYYSFSPAVADLERTNPTFKETVKIFITPMLATLSLLTLAETGSESQVLAFGVSVIALNLGIYIIFPTAAALKVRRYLKARKAASC